MAQKGFLDGKLVASITAEVLLRIMKVEKTNLNQITKKLSPAYPYIWERFNGKKGSYEFYESVAIALGKDRKWYKQLNLDICEYVLNESKSNFIEKFGNDRFSNSELRMII